MEFKYITRITMSDWANPFLRRSRDRFFPTSHERLLDLETCICLLLFLKYGFQKIYFESFKTFLELCGLSMMSQWKTPWKDPRGRGVWRGLRGLFKASFTWEGPSDLYKAPSGVFPRGPSLGHHWRFIVYAGTSQIHFYHYHFIQIFL